MVIQKVLVTGSTGRIGRFTVQELLEHGYAVTGVDQRAAADAHTCVADVCDFGQLLNLMSGHDAVVHLAAIPSPQLDPPQVVFQNNVVSTFNILQAAVNLGMKKIVLASSLSALGFAYRFHDFNLQYLPVDEDHPLLSQDAYGLSKIVGEELAAGFVRQIPELSIISLRFTTVVVAGSGVIERLRGNPNNNHGFWGYVDVRDAATSCRQALEYDASGHQAFYIAAADTYMDEPTQELIRQTMPDYFDLAGNLSGNTGLVNCKRAEQLLGFQPRYHWDGSLLK